MLYITLSGFLSSYKLLHIGTQVYLKHDCNPIFTIDYIELKSAYNRGPHFYHLLKQSRILFANACPAICGDRRVKR